MISFQSLANQFLIAMPSLHDPNFARTVTVICQHDENGALGVVINRKTELTVGDVLQQLDLADDEIVLPQQPIYQGGPVHTELGLILHQDKGEWDSTLAVGNSLGLTTSRDILEAMAQNQGPDHYLMALGYAGWSSGQLEQEIGDNAWLSGPVDPDVIFNTPVEQRWLEAAKLLGVDITRLSAEVGHA